MAFITSLLANEYKLTRIFKALGNEKRFIIVRNLIQGPCYAMEISEAMKISRPGLTKHANTLIREKLIEHKHVVESGNAKSVYELTDFGKKLFEKIEEFKKDVEMISADILEELKKEMIAVNAEIKSVENVIKDIEEKYKEEYISMNDYEAMLSGYKNQLLILRRRRNTINEMLDNV